MNYYSKNLNTVGSRDENRLSRVYLMHKNIESKKINSHFNTKRFLTDISEEVSLISVVVRRINCKKHH